MIIRPLFLNPIHSRSLAFSTSPDSLTVTRVVCSPPPQRPQTVSGFIDRLSSTRTHSLYFRGNAPQSPSTPQYDLIIIGAGPAGVTAAIYAVRRKLKTLLVDRAPVIGGYVAQTSIIENYPSEYSMTGKALAERYAKRLKELNSDESGLRGLLDIQLGEVVMKLTKKDNEPFEVTLDQNRGSFKSRAVIVATGINRKKVPIKRFQELLNKGVSMCTICDGPLYKNKDVAIIGYNQAAIDAAIYIAGIAKTVYLVAPKPITASAESLAVLRSKSSVKEIMAQTAVLEFKGAEKLESMVVKSATTAAREISLHGAFIEADFVSTAKFGTGLLALDEQGQVIVTDDLNAGVPGLFAAGDVTPVKFKQITIAEGQGSNAALKAAEFLQGEDIKADYGKNKPGGDSPKKPPDSPKPDPEK